MHTWNRNISIRVKSTNRPFTLVPYEHGFRSLKAVFSLPEWSWKLWKCMQTLYAGATEDQIATWSQAKESSPRMPWHQAYKITKKENQENLLLRTSLWKNQTSWEMKIFNPLQILHAVRGDAQKCSLWRSQHSCCHGNNDCLFEAWSLIVIQNRRKKSEMIIFLSQTKQNITSWHFYHT